MSESHHSDPVAENVDSHPLRIAIGVVIGAAAVILAIFLLVQFAVGLYGSRSIEDDPAMEPARVEQRIAPIAKVAIDTSKPSLLAEAAGGQAAAPAASAAQSPAAQSPAAQSPAAPVKVPPPAPAAAPAKTASAGAGKKTFDTVCTACHSTGALGAPKFGDKAAWAPRIARGKASLYHSALNGKNSMPPKGGNPGLSDADVKAAVDYMVAAAK